MTRDDIRDIVIAELANIAPETDAGRIDAKEDIRDALDIDSMDFLNFTLALTRRLAVSIPEADTPRLLTVAGATDYLAARLSAS